MKKTVIIVLIAILAMCAIGLGIYIAVLPEPVEPAPVDMHTPNGIIETLGIERSNTNLERLFAIKTYQNVSPTNELIGDIIKMGQVTSFEYLELDPKSNDYLLVTPFEINGKMEIASLKYDPYYEVYVQDTIIFNGNKGENLPENYCLLIRYSRPTTPEFQIKLIQHKEDGEAQTATYQIINTEGTAPVNTIQRIKDDAMPGTESFGEPIILGESQR